MRILGFCLVLCCTSFFLFGGQSAEASLPKGHRQKSSAPKKESILSAQKGSNERADLSRFQGHFQQRGLSLTLHLEPKLAQFMRVAQAPQPAHPASSRVTPRPVLRPRVALPALRRKAKLDCDDVCKELVAKTLLRAALDFDLVKQRESGYRYILRIIREYPGTSSAIRARHLAAEWRRELLSRVDQSGRVEFIVFASLYGLTLGILAPLVVSPNSSVSAPVFGVTMLSFTAGAVAASILLTRKAEMTEGMASLVWNSTLWGAWNFLAIAIIAGADSSNTLRLPVLGSVLGFGVGLIVGKLAKPSAGVGLFAGSLGGWMMAYTGAVMGLISARNINIPSRTAFTALLVLSDIGFIAGVILQPYLKFSRSRVLLLNLGAAVGGATGVGIGLLLQQALPGNDAITFLFISSMVMSLAGVALALFLTKGMPSEKPKEKMASGALLNLNKGHWSVDLPMPMLTPTSNAMGGTQKMGVQVTVPIASGRW